MTEVSKETFIHYSQVGLAEQTIQKYRNYLLLYKTKNYKIGKYEYFCKTMLGNKVLKLFRVESTNIQWFCLEYL